MVEQADEIAGQVLEVVSLNGLGPIGRAIAALIGRNHPDPGGSQRLDLGAPRKRDLRPAVAEEDRRGVGFRAGLVIAHADAIGLGELQRRHFQHRQSLFFLGMIVSENRYPIFGPCARNQLAALFRSLGGANAACSAANSPGSMSQRTCTWGRMLAPAIKPKSSWSR